VTEVLAGYYAPDEHGRRAAESLYRSLKMWAHLNRDGIQVARCTVERLMKANGWRGATRARKVRTTIADPAADQAPDLVSRRFAVEAPNRLFVADFTYVRLVGGVLLHRVRDRRLRGPDRRLGVLRLQAHRVRGTGGHPCGSGARTSRESPLTTR
jgi:transposase InsO family protein